jgi:VIT1/CCC1 family predicted Fe2+/Mn2+ transporter
MDIPKEQTQYVMDKSFLYVSNVSSIFLALVGVCFFIKGTKKSIKKIKTFKEERVFKENKIEELSEKLKEKIVKFDSIEKELKLAKIEIDSIYSVVKEYARADGFSESEMRKFFKTGLELKTEKENDETKIQTIKETLGSLRSTDIEMTNLGKDIDYSDILIVMNRIFSFTLVIGTITAFMGVTGLLFSSLFWSIISAILIVILALSIKQYFDLKPMVKHLDNDYKLNAVKSNKEWAARHKKLSDLQHEKIMLLKKIRSEVNDLSNLKEGLFKKEWNDFITFSR